MATDRIAEKYKNANGLGKAGMIAGGVGLGLATGGLAPAAYGIGSGINKYHNDRVNRMRPGWHRKQALRADIQRMQNPEELGLSDQERTRIMDERMQDSNTQAQAASSDIARTALSGQSFQDGSFAGAQEAIAAAPQQAAASAYADVEDANQRKITQEADRIRAAMADQEERNKENTKYWTNLGINLATTIATMGAGTPGLIAAAGTGPKTGSKAAPADATQTPQTPITEAESAGLDAEWDAFQRAEIAGGN